MTVTNWEEIAKKLEIKLTKEQEEFLDDNINLIKEKEDLEKRKKELFGDEE